MCNGHIGTTPLRQTSTVHELLQPFWPITRLKLLKITVGCAFLILIPYIQFGVIYGLQFWKNNKKEVNRNDCTCSCWDTLFKGTYEKPPAHYKHMYFNLTANTMKIWIITVASIIALYHTVCHLVAVIYNSRARYPMLLLFCFSLYPHLYGWWACVNMWNDDFYKQWKHQTLFSVTEILSTVFVVHLANKNNDCTSNKLLVIITIAIFHVNASGFDQFIHNVVFGNGKTHQVSRDIGFMIPDFLHIIIPLGYLVTWRNTRAPGCSVTLQQFVTSCVAICILSMFTSRL